MANSDVTPFTLQGEPAGLGTLPMGCLDHRGYSMANQNDFYTKFIVELVPNNCNDSKWYKKNLHPLNPTQPRIFERLYNSATRNAINAPDRMNVMYSQAKFGRGRLSQVQEVNVAENDSHAFAEARAWAYEGEVRPRLIHFPLPVENYVWIDMSWPIRNILLPISQVNFPGERPNCTYVQINFRQLQGKLPRSGWMEDGNQGSFKDWVGDNKRGLVCDERMMPDGSAATMRIDLDLLYKLLTLPRHMRKPDYNVFEALQLQRWDVGVPYNFRLPMNSNGHFVKETGQYVSNYHLSHGSWMRRPTEGVAFDVFLSIINGVTVTYPPPPQSAMINILNTVVSVGLGFIPVIGPLLAISSDLAFRVLQDPHSPGLKDLLTAEFGIELAGAIISSALGYQSLKRPGTKAADAPPPGTMPQMLYLGESLEDYKLNPNVMEPTEEEKEMLRKEGPKEDSTVDDSTTTVDASTTTVDGSTNA